MRTNERMSPTSTSRGCPDVTWYRSGTSGRTVLVVMCGLNVASKVLDQGTVIQAGTTGADLNHQRQPRVGLPRAEDKLTKGLIVLFGLEFQILDGPTGACQMECPSVGLPASWGRPHRPVHPSTSRCAESAHLVSGCHAGRARPRPGLGLAKAVCTPVPSGGSPAAARTGVPTSAGGGRDVEHLQRRAPLSAGTRARLRGMGGKRMAVSGSSL